MFSDIRFSGCPIITLVTLWSFFLQRPIFIGLPGDPIWPTIKFSNGPFEMGISELTQKNLETILNELKVSILTKIALDAEFQKSVQFQMIHSAQKMIVSLMLVSLFARDSNMYLPSVVAIAFFSLAKKFYMPTKSIEID